MSLDVAPGTPLCTLPPSLESPGPLSVRKPFPSGTLASQHILSILNLHLATCWLGPETALSRASKRSACLPCTPATGPGDQVGICLLPKLFRGITNLSPFETSAHRICHSIVFFICLHPLCTEASALIPISWGTSLSHSDKSSPASLCPGLQ